MDWLYIEKPVKYVNSLVFMEKIVDLMTSGLYVNDIVVSLQHDDVYTCGSSAEKSDFLIEDISNLNVVDVSRGGKITYHGHGQFVCYFVIDLSKKGVDIRSYVIMLQNVIINTLNLLDIKAFVLDKNVGVWVKKQDSNYYKISSIGIKMKKCIAYHGISINCNNDLSKFNVIRPCGMDPKFQTSISEMGTLINLRDLCNLFRKEFYKIFI